MKNRLWKTSSSLVISSVLLSAITGCAGRMVRQPGSETPAPVQAKTPPESQEIEHVTAEQVVKNTREVRKNTEASAEYHFSLAQAYVAEGNPDRAIEEYKL